MKKIAIHDASILIDLIKAKLFSHCLSLEYEFITTDIILAELYPEQASAIKPHIDSGEFIVVKLSEDELVEVQVMEQNDARLSPQDWSACYCALKKNALLLTGDKRLKEIAINKGLEAHGILWLFDQLIAAEKMSCSTAVGFLEKVYSFNKRLPFEEVEKRKKLWNNNES